MSETESISFVRFENNGVETVAHFILDNPHVSSTSHGEKRIYDMFLNKESCKVRLKNLQEGGYAHEQTLFAMNLWPKE